MKIRLFRFQVGKRFKKALRIIAQTGAQRAKVNNFDRDRFALFADRVKQRVEVASVMRGQRKPVREQRVQRVAGSGDVYKRQR